MAIRYIHCRSEQKNYRQPILVWYRVKMKSDLEGIATFFVHRRPHKPSVWTVSEEMCGAHIAGEHVTRYAAIHAAKTKLESVSAEAFKVARQRSLKYLGCPVIDLPDLPKGVK